MSTPLRGLSARSGFTSACQHFVPYGRRGFLDFLPRHPSGRLAFHGALLLEDEVHQLCAEIRGGMDVLDFDLDLVEALEPEHVSAGWGGFGDDAAEEETEIS